MPVEQNYIYKQFSNNLIKKAISIISEPFDLMKQVRQRSFRHVI